MTDTEVDNYDDDEVDQDDEDDEVDEVDDGNVDPNAIPAATAADVLEYLVRAVVADPDAVEIEIDESHHTIALNVHVAPDDMGRVIGRRGRIANSIRTVVRAAAARDDTSVEVEFVD
jgi:predicted RNA-binding protein YlqC (UPF0109 family)